MHKLRDNMRSVRRRGFLVALAVLTSGCLHIYEDESPGSVAVSRISEGRVGDREVIPHDDEQVKNLDTLQLALERASEPGYSKGMIDMVPDEENEMDALLELAEYEPIQEKQTVGDYQVLYVRYQGDVYEVHPLTYGER